MGEDSVKHTETHSTTRRYNVATVVVFALAIIIGVVLIYSPRFSSLEMFTPEEKIQEIQGDIMPESLPVRLVIPRLNIDTGFEAPLGLKDDGEIEVPEGYTDVGYYKFGPTPGELGPSVILGHVDSVDGPAVFYTLGQLEEGDEIRVEREDGSVAIFAVTELERHPQSGFPTKQVYGDIDHAGLRLITCSGIYQHDTLRYTHNLIVFAKLVSTSTVSQ